MLGRLEHRQAGEALSAKQPPLSVYITASNLGCILHIIPLPQQLPSAVLDFDWDSHGGRWPELGAQDSIHERAVGIQSQLHLQLLMPISPASPSLPCVAFIGCSNGRKAFIPRTRGEGRIEWQC